MIRELALLSFSSLLILVSCNQNKNTPQPSAGEPFQIDAATAATIQGTISFAGMPPKPAKIDMRQDPACEMSAARDNYGEGFSVENGKLANVFVYVKDGLQGKTFPPSKNRVILDQRGCRYLPHVLAVMARQPIRILNSDPTLHNVHPSPHVPGNHEWNISQQPRGAPMEKSFAQPEIMMSLSCNNHPWMRAYLNVAANPFYSISSSDGKFEIQGLPPGTYKLAAVHEKLGEQAEPITVSAKQHLNVDFTFKQ